MSSNCSSRVIRGMAGLVLVSISLLLLTLQMSAADSSIKWGAPRLSEDGSTVVKWEDRVYDVFGMGGTFGFFSPDGKERAVIRRHGVYGSYMSEDGYLAVWGTVAGKKGFYVTLYDPYGKMRWEMKTDPEEPHTAAVSRKGARVFVSSLGPDHMSSSLLVINSAGAVVKKVPLTDDVAANALQVLGDRLLAVSTGLDYRAYSADEQMKELWRTSHSETTTLYGFAATPDLSQIAVIDADPVKIGGKPQYPPRMILLDGKTGKEIRRKALDVSEDDMDPLRPVRYDQSKHSFVIVIRNKKGEKPIDMSDPEGSK